MLLNVPASLDGLLSLLAPCFTQPSFQTFRALVVGQVSQTGLRTVCGMLVGARLSRSWHHARAHRFFSAARWSADELGLRIAELIAARLCDPGAPLLVALDDTLLHRLGRKVHASFWHHDAPKGKPDPERPAKPALAREMVDLLAARLDREIDVVGDAAYATSGWRGLQGRVTVTSRLRSNAAIFARKPPRTGKRGRPAQWGRQLGSLDQIATAAATDWQHASVRRYSKTENLMLHAIESLWGPLGPETPVRVILVKDADKACGYQIALITTDLTSTPAQIVERYADRWPIEVAYEDAKHVFGVGEARNRTPKAVERTVPFQFLCMTLTILWYALAGHHPDVVSEHRARAPWYRTKANPSTADMLAKLRRVIIAAQYHPGPGQTPTSAEITQVQQAWAAAAL
ncbi:MAG: transposase [Actinobacteria bacterium]|nr:transposase [Actinomycetota bacterium]